MVSVSHIERLQARCTMHTLLFNTRLSRTSAKHKRENMFNSRRGLCLFNLLTLIMISNVYSKDRLLQGESLSNDQYISSPNGKYRLIMQTDGSLVMYRSDGSVRYRMEKYGTFAIMQHDNNFVEYRGTTALWNTGTSNVSCPYACYLQIHDNGDLGIEWMSPSGNMGGGWWGIGPDPVPAPSPGYPLTVLAPSGPPPSYPPAWPWRAEFDNSVPYNLDPRH